MAKRPVKPMHLTPRFGNPPVGRPPKGFSSMDLDTETRMFLERQALDIFTEMANAGKPFACCLSAILLSGINWGVKAEAE